MSGTPDTRECSRCGLVKPLDCYRLEPSRNGTPYRRRVCLACRKRTGRPKRDLSAYYRAWRATPLGKLVVRKQVVRRRLAYWRDAEAAIDRRIAELKRSVTHTRRRAGAD